MNSGQTLMHPICAFVISACTEFFLCVFIFIWSDLRTHTHTHHILTVSYGLHAEAQQCMQEVHNVIERVFVDVLAHGLTKLNLVQLVKAGQAVLGLQGEFRK